MHQDQNSHTTQGASSTSARQGKPGSNNRVHAITSPALTTAPQPAAGHRWDKAAAGWNRNGALVADWLRDATPAMLNAARITAGSHVLDIAAGSGNQTLETALRVGSTGHILATDISAHSLALAQEKLHAAGFDGIETRVADAQALGLADAGFDAAICRLGLMFCQAPLDALCGILAALRPGGRFSGLVFSGPQHNPCIAILASTAMQHADLPQASP